MIAGPFEHVEKGGDEWSTDSECECPGLEEVGDKQCGCRLVESVFLLEHKCLI